MKDVALIAENIDYLLFDIYAVFCLKNFQAVLASVLLRGNGDSEFR